MGETVSLPPTKGRKLTKIIPFRVSKEEFEAYRLAAKSRKMEMSAWLRSACATFLVCGRNTVSVPAGGILEPAYYTRLKREGSARLVVDGDTLVDEAVDDAEKDFDLDP